MPQTTKQKRLKQPNNSLPLSENHDIVFRGHVAMEDMKQYKRRIADEILKFKLESKGAVLVEGAKWCGKTTVVINKKLTRYPQVINRCREK